MLNFVFTLVVNYLSINYHYHYYNYVYRTMCNTGIYYISYTCITHLSATCISTHVIHQKHHTYITDVAQLAMYKMPGFMTYFVTDKPFQDENWKQSRFPWLQILFKTWMHQCIFSNQHLYSRLILLIIRRFRWLTSQIQNHIQSLGGSVFNSWGFISTL